ncbi:MAG: HlyD family efflux transporter periplasmic adaptor subunit [Candidatus Nanopelagicales bacterium]|nr:HlyD family efflux transporter periplasmic adaptor subunit [Candidatus Nanopelagicales bacterium]
MGTLFRDRAATGTSSADTLNAQVRVVRLPAWAALCFALLLLAGLAVWLFAGTVAITTGGSGVVNNAPANAVVSAPVTGLLTRAAPPVGTAVRAGDVIGKVKESWEDESTIVPVLAPVAGTVIGIGAGSHTGVSYGDYLATIAPDTADQIGYLFIPVEKGGEYVQPGMSALLIPDSAEASSEGQLRGRVTAVSPIPVTRSRIMYITAAPEYTDILLRQGPSVEVQIELLPDPANPTGWDWTLPPGPSQRLVSGVSTNGTVVLEEVSPYRTIFGS